MNYLIVIIFGFIMNTACWQQGITYLIIKFKIQFSYKHNNQPFITVGYLHQQILSFLRSGNAEVLRSVVPPFLLQQLCKISTQETALFSFKNQSTDYREFYRSSMKDEYWSMRTILREGRLIPGKHPSHQINQTSQHISSIYFVARPQAIHLTFVCFLPLSRDNFLCLSQSYC